MSRRLTFHEAGSLLANQKFRKAMTGHKLTAGLRRVTPSGDAEAAITSDNVLIITGSDGFGDYFRYNLRPNRKVTASPERARIAKVIPIEALHGGFLLHATEVLKFLGQERPDFIVGHSLGAASAQIVGTTLGIPTITFAAPQVVRTKKLKDPRWRLPGHRQWNVYNVRWNHDLVTKGFHFVGMQNLGFSGVFKTPSGKTGIDHFAKDYADLILKDSKSPRPGMPKHWRLANYRPPRRTA